MRDKLTKKRVKADYRFIVKVLNLDSKFFKYCESRFRVKSTNRRAYTFLKKSGYSDDQLLSIWLCIKEKGFSSYEEWLKETIRIAKTPWLDDDD